MLPRICSSREGSDPSLKDILAFSLHEPEAPISESLDYHQLAPGEGVPSLPSVNLGYRLLPYLLCLYVSAKDLNSCSYA